MGGTTYMTEQDFRNMEERITSNVSGAINQQNAKLDAFIKKTEARFDKTEARFDKIDESLNVIRKHLGC